MLKRARLVRIWMALAGVGAARLSQAQTPGPLSTLDTLFPTPRINSARFYGIGQDGHVDVDPDLIHFDDTTRTATVTFRNPTAQVDTVWLAPECGGDGHPQPEDPLAAAWQNQYPCAAPWVSGYPQYLPLAPHERRTLTLQLHPYPTLPDGRYIARLMVNGIVSEAGHDETAIEYIKGPTPPRRSRVRWEPARSGTSVVRADRSVVVLDQHTRTATVTLTNQSAAATELWLMLDCPWFRVHYETVPGYTNKSQYEYLWHRDTPNIVTWLSGLPQHLVLAPHARRTLTLRLTPFYNMQGWAGGDTNYPVGSYYAQLWYLQAPVLHVTPGGDTTFTTPSGAIAVVYHQGRTASPLTVSHLERTALPDGRSRVCVTLQQPGLGLVATLHADVDDVHGHPVSPSLAHQRRGDRSIPWAVDTTVALWEIVRPHDPQRTDPGTPVVPDPVCLTVPAFVSGRYHLTLSVQALGGAPVHATLPFEVPRQGPLPGAVSPAALPSDSVLTDGVLAKLTTFFTAFSKEADSVRMIPFDGQIGPTARMTIDTVYSGARMNRTEIVYNMTVLAAMYPTVAQDLQQAGLTSQRYTALLATLLNACRTFNGVSGGNPVIPTAAEATNIALLRTHVQAFIGLLERADSAHVLGITDCGHAAQAMPRSPTLKQW